MRMKLTNLLKLAIWIDVTIFAGYESVDVPILNAERSVLRLVSKGVGAVFVMLIDLAKYSCVG